LTELFKNKGGLFWGHIVELYRLSGLFHFLFQADIR